MNRTLEQIYNNQVFSALNPSRRPFLEAQLLPPRLNPFAHDIINMSALVSFKALPNIKAVPALQMMLEDFENGVYENVHTVVVDSSGNTAYAVARLAPAFGLEVKIVVASDVPQSKMAVLDALSTVHVIKVGGGASVAKYAAEEGSRPGHYHLNQYDHLGNMNSHELYTGPEVLRALGKVDLGVIAISMGSAGTAAGVGRFLKKKNPDVVVVGCVPKLGEQVPGARDRKRLRDIVTLPWEDIVDVVVEISRKESFLGTRELWSSVEPIVGPTSGLAYMGLLRYLGALSISEKKRLYGKHAAFICPDGGYLYSDVIISELDTGQGV